MSVTVREAPVKVEVIRAFLTQGKNDLDGLVIGNDDGLGGRQVI